MRIGGKRYERQLMRIESGEMLDGISRTIRDRYPSQVDGRRWPCSQSGRAGKPGNAAVDWTRRHSAWIVQAESWIRRTVILASDRSIDTCAADVSPP